MFNIDEKKIVEIIKNFINISAISWFESDIEKYIYDICNKKWIKSTIFPWFWICVWNPNSKNYVFAHSDEVWWKIIEVWDKIKFEWIWRVKPSMFIWRDIEIIAENKKIPAIVVWKIPLKIDYQSFDELEVIVCESDKKYLKIWMSLRYKTNFIETNSSIFSTSLDNRISISMLIYLLDFFIEELNSWKICFCFAWEEELKNKWALFFINTFKPEKFIIPDVFPMSFLWENKLTDKSIILRETLDYKINKDIEKLFINKSFLFIDSNLDLLKRSEVSQYENIYWWTWISIGISVLNYHNWTYFTSKKCLKNFLKDSYFLIKNFF